MSQEQFKERLVHIEQEMETLNSVISENLRTTQEPVSQTTTEETTKGKHNSAGSTMDHKRDKMVYSAKPDGLKWKNSEIEEGELQECNRNHNISHEKVTEEIEKLEMQLRELLQSGKKGTADSQNKGKEVLKPTAGRHLRENVVQEDENTQPLPAVDTSSPDIAQDVSGTAAVLGPNIEKYEQVLVPPSTTLQLAPANVARDSVKNDTKLVVIADQKKATKTKVDASDSPDATKCAPAGTETTPSHMQPLKMAKQRQIHEGSTTVMRSTSINGNGSWRSPNPFRVVSITGGSKSSHRSSTSTSAAGTVTGTAATNLHLRATSQSSNTSPPDNTTAISSAEDYAIGKLQRKHDYLTMKCVKLSKELKYLNNMKDNGSLPVEDTRKLSKALEKLQEYLDKKTKEKYEIGVLLSRKIRKQIDNGSTGQFWLGGK
ncbi:Bni5p Ecym_6408 [Eremothecium cymbalariae DBVPG|uniref:Uncharacterized protein n=1 Tax=Eremothecium cymbalariae (strain CBS 270.75 / DBVPG 7215 / KCTC 17166 / NRRL Y-17582) TaxID=931890 RepID=G8JUK1_ERECY|nr:hypothetical protein Ecym_6408 [Eremothecium cymbalariae DBVPG\